MTTALGRAAVFAALLFATPAPAQDVTLTAQDGALSIDGTLQAYDGEVYRLLTDYGLLTVDAEGVICQGPACPSLTVPKAVIRILGTAAAGEALLPPLFAAFAKAKGLDFTPQQGAAPALLREAGSGQVMAEISFLAADPGPARAAMAAGATELVLTQAPFPEANARVLARDALVAIAAPDNPTPRLATTALARVLTGEVTNWAEVGGPDMPLELHALAPDSDLSLALAARLGGAVMGDVTHANPADLVAAVARDPWALAVVGRAQQGQARVLELTDSCGFPLLANNLTVKAEDYPLAMPVQLLMPPRRLPRLGREFVEFIDTPQAQAVIEAAGFIGTAEARAPLVADGLRLMNAIRGAGEDMSLAELQRLASAMDGADRSSLTFRFAEDGLTLDASSQTNLAILARMLESGELAGKALALAGFSDGSGGAKTNLQLSRDRIEAVLQALRQAAPGLAEAALPAPLALGEALPIGCDQTPAGRRLNRRVELWIRPGFPAAPEAAP